MYDKDTVTKPTKSRPQTKEIKDRIKDFVRTNVQLLCEIPSCKMSSERDLTTVAEKEILGELEVSSVDYTLSLITTPNDKEVWSQKRKSRDNQENNPQPETDQITVTSWLPESV